MLKKLFAYNASWSALLLLLLVLPVACVEDDDPIGPEDPGTNFFLGWNQSTEDLSDVPSNITFGNGNGSLPSAVDLTKFFPPIGDQGQFGTCVTWACGYNLKTALEAMDQNFTSSQLNNPANQMSPADLWQAIAASNKNASCGGTNFEPALDVIQSRGVANLQTAPYSQLSCEATPPNNWTSAAAGNKIQNYRKINIDVNEIKGYIADNRPVALGARLGDNFMSWNTDDVISNHSSFNNVGQHAYHAMVVVGYDDNKGPNGAFRVVNSWSNNWGDAGLIWVDYNFFVTDFCFAAFVATNQKGAVNPDDPVDPNVTGGDLVPWNVYDDFDPFGNFYNERYFQYNVYNVGSATVPASARWNFSYLFYNAYNANDYGIILFDYYTNEFGSPGQSDRLTVGNPPGIADNWWNHIDLPSGTGVAEILTGGSYFEWSYTMPNITGYYYLVAFADAYDNVQEGDESDNLYYLTNDYGDPLYIENGFIVGFKGKDPDELKGPSNPSKEAVKQTIPSMKSDKHKNAYTPSEIKQFIKAEKESGRLEAKTQEWLKSNTATKKSVRKGQDE